MKSEVSNLVHSIIMKHTWIRVGR